MKNKLRDLRKELEKESISVKSPEELLNTHFQKQWHTDPEEMSAKELAMLAGEGLSSVNTLLVKYKENAENILSPAKSLSPLHPKRTINYILSKVRKFLNPLAFENFHFNVQSAEQTLDLILKIHIKSEKISAEIKTQTDEISELKNLTALQELSRDQNE